MFFGQFGGLSIVSLSQEVVWSFFSMLLSTTFVALLIESCFLGIWQLEAHQQRSEGSPWCLPRHCLLLHVCSSGDLVLSNKIRLCNNPRLFSALILPPQAWNKSKYKYQENWSHAGDECFGQRVLIHTLSVLIVTFKQVTP